MGLSLEGFREEFEIGNIAFELEDLKKNKEKRREKIGDFAFFQGDLGFRERRIYIRERGMKRRKLFFIVGGDSFLVRGRIGEDALDDWDKF